MTLDEAIKRITDCSLFAKPYNPFVKCEYTQLAEWLKELKERREKQEWIPCSERLPEHDDRVLTYDTDGDINIMWFDGRDEEGEDVWKDDYSIEWCDIVAWMPLPEPWKGADNDSI